LTVFTFTVMEGFALWKSAAIPFQYFVLLLAGPVP
jgi:hypothetical protein